MDIANYRINLVSSYLKMGIGFVLFIIFTPYIVNTLGTVQYGMWILLNSIMDYFNLSSLGMNTTLLKEVSARKDDPSFVNRMVNTTFFAFAGISLMVCLGVLGILLNISILFDIPPEHVLVAKKAMAVIYFIFVANFLTSVFSSVLFAEDRLYLANFTDAMRSLLSMLLTYAVLVFDGKIFEIALVTFIASAGCGLFQYAMSRRYSSFSLSVSHFDKKLLARMVKPSMHYFLLHMAGMIIFYSDNIVISSFLGVSLVGLYSIGYQAVDGALQVLFKITDVLIPNISKLFEEKQYRKIRSLHNRYLLLVVILSTVVFGIMYFTLYDIMQLWVGEEKVVSVWILRLFIGFAFVQSYVHVSGVFITAIGIHREASYSALIEAALNLALSIIFLKIWGLYGVALGTLVSILLTGAWFGPFWFYFNMRRYISGT